MNDDSGDEVTETLPSGMDSEYGLGGMSEPRRPPDADGDRLREEYGRLRAYFKRRHQAYADLQRSLNQARSGTSYDVYLTNGVRYAASAAVVGAVIGVLLTLLLDSLGVVAGLQSPLQVTGSVSEYVGRNRLLLVGAGLSVALALTLSGLVWQIRYRYPGYVASGRRRNIDVTLPHAITFMYALSYGGMDLLEVIDVIAEKEDTYGEVANECQMIARDVELFGNDIYSALQNARNLTPSRHFEQFLDDMIAVLDAGGDLTAFFESESDEYLEESREEQESFLELLALLSEVFVVGFVAAPLFLIVILVMISLLGGNTVEELTALVYVVLPLAMIAFVVLIDTLSEPYRIATVEFDIQQAAVLGGSRSVLRSVLGDRIAVCREWVAVWAGTDDAVPDPLTETEKRQRQYLEYERHRRLQTARELLANPLDAISDRPTLTLAFSVPAATLLVGVTVAAGLVTPTGRAVVEEPVWTTTLLFVLPLLVVLVPLSAFHERKAGRNREIASRFPDTLNVLSSANRMGVAFTDALTLVSRWTRGPLAAEIETVRNDIRWNFDTHSALYAFADRLRVAQLSRTLTLIAEGARSSTDLSRVLAIAAEDTRERERARRRRHAELSSYIAVVVIGFLVYLLVILLLSASYLEPIAEAAATAPEIPGQPESPLALQNVPIQTYQALFFHSALIQGLGVGVLAGKLSNDSLLGGLKYSIALVALTLIAFTLA
ncbi:type II secretion system F family protein [Halorientalis salina]|uniref:type II secretion system F family protein n=1 Tax=Halorientalis salina TaxID=2932266 RepID=UPI0010AC70F4|nr:type II secretion system F family protein [Halorientalis salina]